MLYLIFPLYLLAEIQGHLKLRHFDGLVQDYSNSIANNGVTAFLH